ncbi:hypothetical protein CEP52_017707, partial [Fusarium oligoseptatum]
MKTDIVRSHYNTTSVDSIYPIQVCWRGSDLANLETHPLSSGVTPASAEDGDAGDDGAGSNQGGDALSGGAIAGIVV